MDTVKLLYNNKLYKISKEKIVYILYKLTDKDFSNADEETLLKIMKKYSLIDEIFLDSLN